MLSKAEFQYLNNPQSVSATYGYVLKNRIRAKLAAMGKEINLIENCKNLTNLTEFRKIQSQISAGEINPNRVAFNKWEAPRMGFEPMRNGCSTGSQGPRVNHSATSAPINQHCISLVL
jgi:hypothetical protein